MSPVVPSAGQRKVPGTYRCGFRRIGESFQKLRKPRGGTVQGFDHRDAEELSLVVLIWRPTNQDCTGGQALEESPGDGSHRTNHVRNVLLCIVAHVHI